MSLNDRKNAVRTAKLCFNCLNYGHQVATCKFSCCPKCNKKHNSKLHDNQAIDNTLTNPNPNEQSSNQHHTVLYTETATTSKHNAKNMNVMLSTALIHVYDQCGQLQVCRAVLNSGSQLNFISADCALTLGLPLHTSPLNIKLV